VYQANSAVAAKFRFVLVSFAMTHLEPEVFDTAQLEVVEITGTQATPVVD
jgi:hypothetical protein